MCVIDALIIWCPGYLGMAMTYTENVALKMTLPSQILVKFGYGRAQSVSKPQAKSRHPPAENYGSYG